jgi:hypothetical protein
MASVRSERTVIPVIINVDWKQSLLNSVREACQINNYWLTIPMIRNLAGRGRIILIIDGLSEIREDLNGEHLSFRHILVTSRKTVSENEALFRTVKVGSLAYNNKDQLEGFISRYACKSEKKIREWAQQLIKQLGDPKGQIRPIFAWLAVEYARNNIGSENKKGYISHHELVMRYVELLRSRGKLVLSEDSFRRSAELAAYTEICENWSPRMVTRDTMQSRLREKGKEMPFRTESNKVIPGDIVLEHLEQCGLLQSGSTRQSKPISKRHYISFTYDLVAEHLAVEHIFGLPELPTYTKKEIEESGSEFAKIFETVQKAHFPISSNK